jgi:hypothetical protein
MKILKNLAIILISLFATTKTFSQTTVTIGGGATISCPAVPTATWTTPPSGVTISNWSRGSGVTCVSAANGLSGSAFNSGNLTSARSNSKFFSATISTNSTTTVTLNSLVWNTTVSSGACNFTVGYINNGGTFTTFGTTAQTNLTSNTFSGSVTISPSTSLILYLFPIGASSGATVRWLNGSTITMTVLGPTITTSGTLSTLTTTYGTSSASSSFSVSGANMTSGITITPPVGIEVSTTSTFTTVGTNTSPITIGSTGTISSTTIHTRLAASALPGTFNSRTISLTATSATTRTVSTTSSGNVVSPKTLTISSPQVTTKVYNGTNSATITGTLSGIINSDIVNLNGTGTFASVNAGTGISVTSTSTLGGTHQSRYTLTQPTGLTGTINKATQTITFSGLPYKSTLDVDFTPAASASSGLPLSYSSSNTSVASIVSGKIKINGVGTTTITANQSGDGNYFPATSVSNTFFVDNPISRWSFDAITISGTGQTPTISQGGADVGLQTENTNIGGFHTSSSTVWSTPVGNGNSKSFSANNWNVNDFFRFTVNTQYTTIIKLTFDQTSSSTGPKDFKLQWSTNGTTFNDITTYTVPFNTVTNTDYSWSSTTYRTESTLSFDLSVITGINNQPNLVFRLINTSTNALLGGTVGSTGTSRVDNFTMFGELDVPLDLEGWIKNNPRPEIVITKKEVSDCDLPTVYYDFTGRQVEKLQPGKIYIKKSCGQSERFMITE